MSQIAFDSSGLLPHQVSNAIHLCNTLVAEGAAIDGGDTGTGKTYEIMAVARHRNEAPLVICPKSVRSSWQRVAAYLGGAVHVVNYEALKGKNEWGEMTSPEGYHEAAQDYRELKARVTEFRARLMTVETRLNQPELTQEERRTIREEALPGDLHSLLAREDRAKRAFKALKRHRVFKWKQLDIPFIVFDEGQRCKAPDSLNAKIMIAAKRQNFPVIIASATAAQTPLEMKALGYVLGLHKGTDFWQWCQRNGCKPSSFGGFRFVGGDPTMLKIHHQIYPRFGCRTRREDVPGFPESQITAELYDLDGHEKIDELYAEMADSLAALKLKSAADLDLEHPLTRMLRARQRVELIKVPLFFELAEDAIVEGMSVAIFVNFDETIKELYQRFSEANIPFGQIVGGQTEEERDLHIARFQDGRARAELCNLKAGGVGVSLHDLDGKHPRLALISPTFSALDLVQVLGRVWRQGGKSKSIQRIVLAANTVEQHIHSRIGAKLANISLLNDGDLNPLIK